MKLGILAIVMSIMLTGTHEASSEEYPDIRGTWVGISEAIVTGATNHYPTETEEERFQQRLKTMPITITIDQQSDRRYAGTIASAMASEQIVGVMASDGRLLWVDEDGYVQGQLSDADTMDICYLLVQPDVQLAACATLQREP